MTEWCKEESRLQVEVDGLLQQATDADARDDAQYRTDRTGDELLVELVFREGRLRKIREAKAVLEQAANEAREAEGPSPGPKPQPPWRCPNEASPTRRAESCRPQATRAALPKAIYNCQAVVDTTAHIIIAADVTQATNDKQQAQPLLQQAIANTGQVPTVASLDAGYYSLL